MNTHHTRREFLKQSALAAGALALASDNLLGAATAPKRTATDLVPLGSTGLKISRLAMGTGSANGHTQTHGHGPGPARPHGPQNQPSCHGYGQQ